MHGRVDAEDVLVDPAIAVLRPTESYDGGRHRYDAEVGLARSGPFGYTVRVAPGQPAAGRARRARASSPSPDRAVELVVPPLGRTVWCIARVDR